MTTQKTNLDSKLREIIGTVGEAHPGNVCCEHCEKELQLGIAQIHKAFADEGYQKLPKAYKVTDIENQWLMTGQEWFSRFEKEAPGTTEPHVFEAAKKAAGLTK